MPPNLAQSDAGTHLLEVRRLAGVWRLVVRGTRRLARNANGTAVDGGGHDEYGQARRQLDAIRYANLRAGRIQPGCR